jgi:6,7-dimethyl-8-ribityllumazine synthase
MNQMLQETSSTQSQSELLATAGDPPRDVVPFHFARPPRVAFVQSCWHRDIVAEARTDNAIVAAGLVVDGGIYRHDFVAGAVIDALMDVQMRTEVPIFSAVLTPQQFHEHTAHFEFFRKHFAIKGVEVAEACAQTLYSLENLRGQVAAGIM